MQNGYDPVRAEEIGQAMLALLILGLLLVLSRVWCSRVERRMVVSPGESFWRTYGRLLWRECWRSFVVTVAIGVVFAFRGETPEDAGQKIAFVTVLYPLLFIVVAATAWRATKRLFQNQNSITTSALSSVRSHRADEAIGSRIRKHTNKLNGWQRAWVVTALIWAGVVVLFAGIISPASPERIRKMKDDEWVNALYEQGGRNLRLSRDELLAKVNKPMPDDVADLDTVLPAGVADPIIAKYDALIKKYPHDLAVHIVNSAALWAFPLIVIYLLGLGAAWVRAGFRPKKQYEQYS